MITKIHVKRVVILSAMIVLMLVVGLAGFIFINKKANATVENLSFKGYCDFTASVEGAVGTIKDDKGEVLCSEQFHGDVSTYNLIGELKNIAATNTVAYANKEKMIDATQYKFFKGADSLKNTALDVYTTVDYKLQKAVYEYMKERGISNGSALFMDEKTGAIKIAVSLPAADPEVSSTEWKEGSLINKNFEATIPGSTMKVITGMLLYEMCPSMLEHYVVCDGSYEISTAGASVTCITQRGKHNLVSALGVSCNCFFADSIVQKLNPKGEVVCKRLRELGILTESNKKFMERGNLTYKSSMAAYTGENTFESIWSLIGEGNVLMSPLDMCRIVSGIVNEGTGKVPFLLESVRNRAQEVVETAEVKDSYVTNRETAVSYYSIWKEAYDTYYGPEYHSDVTVAKTGTAEYENKGVSKNLVGYMEKQGLVFFISVEDYEQSQIMPYEIVNYICEQI